MKQSRMSRNSKLITSRSLHYSQLVLRLSTYHRYITLSTCSSLFLKYLKEHLRYTKKILHISLLVGDFYMVRTRSNYPIASVDILCTTLFTRCVTSTTALYKSGGIYNFSIFNKVISEIDGRKSKF